MENKTFSNGEYKEVDNRIVPENKKNGFVLKLNIYALFMIVILSIGTVMIFGSFSFVIEGIDSLLYFAGFIISFLLYIVIHELLHGVGFVLFGEATIKDLKFGVIFKNGMAYCISTVPVSVKTSRISLMMPVYVICIPMYIIGVITNSFYISLLAVFFLSGSVGDFYYMLLLRKTDKNLYMYEEAPTKTGYQIGYILYEKVS